MVSPPFVAGSAYSSNSGLFQSPRKANSFNGSPLPFFRLGRAAALPKHMRSPVIADDDLALQVCGLLRLKRISDGLRVEAAHLVRG